MKLTDAQRRAILSAQTDRDTYIVKGTIVPALLVLEREGLVSLNIYDERVSYYRLTPAGQSIRAELSKEQTNAE